VSVFVCANVNEDGTFFQELGEIMKRRILYAIARFGGKLMFAALKLDGLQAMEVTDPTTGEFLIAFPHSAGF
jgi:hypothetical protein